MSVGFAVATVIAHHCGLDHAGAVIRRPIRQRREHAVAGVKAEGRHRRRGLAGRFCAAHVLGNGGANECAQLIVVHSLMSTVSMIPTTAASTGAPLRPSASPAARPSITTSTLS